MEKQRIISRYLGDFGWECPWQDFRDVVIDSGKASKGSLFVAINSGYKYAPEAMERGALCVIERRYAQGLGIPSGHFLLVDSSLSFLQGLAKSFRYEFKGKVIGITGSCGKTTLKELLFCALKKEGIKVSASVGNLNNEIGLPLSIVNFDLHSEVWIVEMGISRPGDMDILVEIARPDIAVITNVGNSHTLYLGSEEGVFNEKIKILRYAEQAYINLDLKEYMESIACKAIMFSDADDNFPNQTVLNLILRKEFGFTPVNEKKLHNMDIYLPHRFEKKGINGVFVVDDSYNANPLSMSVSLNRFSQLARGEVLLILADMLELGEDSLTHHQRVLDLVMELFPKAHIVLIGENMNEAASAIGLPVFMRFPCVSGAKRSLPPLLHNYNSIFLKGSNSFRLWELLDIGY